MKLNTQNHEAGELLSEPEYSSSEIVIGNLSSINDKGEPVINFFGNALNRPLVAISTVALSKQHIGRQVAILFANGKADTPVIMGLIHSPLNELIDSYQPVDANLQNPEVTQLVIEDTQNQVVNVDGKKIMIEGQDEVVLKCGDASITLTKAGKILIRGKYLLNRSDGVNRIMGGSVQVN